MEHYNFMYGKVPAAPSLLSWEALHGGWYWNLEGCNIMVPDIIKYMLLVVWCHRAIDVKLMWSWSSST